MSLALLIEIPLKSFKIARGNKAVAVDLGVIGVSSYVVITL